MSTLKRFCSRLPLIPLLLLPLLAHGEEEQRWYQVEVIIFSQNSPDYHESEIWPLDFKLPDLENSRELLKYKKPAKTATTPQLPEAFSLADKDSLQLGETASRIKRAKDVELMLHLSWVQPGLAEDQAVAVHIYEGMLKQIALAASSTKKAKPAAVKQKPLSLEEDPLGLLQASQPKLDGTLRLTLSRYLHLQSDLVWREPLPPSLYGFAQPLAPVDEAIAPSEEPVESTANIGGQNYQVFRMQQSSRMRSSEIHYQDHPLFGIIAVVNRYEPAQAEQPATAAQ